MNLLQILDVYSGGPGSGCNPEVGKCGRPSTGSSKYNLKSISRELAKSQPLPKSWSAAKQFNWQDRSYGGVLVNPQGEFLLRSPTNFFDGYHWTFAKGGLNYDGEHPADAAIREVREETGYRGEIIKPLEGTFYSKYGSSNNFYLMRGNSRNKELMDKETYAVRWANYDEAKRLITKTTNLRGRERDLRILEEANRILKTLRKA